jgi:hypothetical protein
LPVLLAWLYYGSLFFIGIDMEVNSIMGVMKNFFDNAVWCDNCKYPTTSWQHEDCCEHYAKKMDKILKRNRQPNN